MTQDELMQVLQAGESSMVEFKRCSELPHTDTFETVCSFANRSGGSIYLGVDDDGQVLGVDSKRVSEIERNVVNVVSNRKMFEPAPMVETEHIEYDERIIVRIWVAPSSSVVRFKGAVFDRIADVDTHIESDIQISQMYIRKQNYYSERRIFRYVTPFDLRPELIARMRSLSELGTLGELCLTKNCSAAPSYTIVITRPAKRALILLQCCSWARMKSFPRFAQRILLMPWFGETILTDTMTDLWCGPTCSIRTSNSVNLLSGICLTALC